jgi:transposase
MKQTNGQTEENRLEWLSALGDPLEKMGKRIDWEAFRPMLDNALNKKAKGPGGRPSWDHVLMFKIMMLQRWNNIADDRTEFLINDRLSFQRFLGLGLGDKVPDAKTLWLFRENLKKSGAEKPLFELLKMQLEEEGLITNSGSIVDVAFVDVPRPRNTRKENQAVQKGETPED